ncbi:hypothetical protein AUP68_06513 [Ilyonectria robusta]
MVSRHHWSWGGRLWLLANLEDDFGIDMSSLGSSFADAAAAMVSLRWIKALNQGRSEVFLNNQSFLSDHITFRRHVSRPLERAMSKVYPSS